MVEVGRVLEILVELMETTEMSKTNTFVQTATRGGAEVLTQRRSLGGQRGGADQLHTPSEYYRHTQTHTHRREDERVMG